MPDPRTVKIAFELEQDENGYPPDKWETLWADEVGKGLYRLDNIPFFARGVSPEDIVRARRKSGLLVFKEVVTPSKNSVFRIYAEKEEDVQGARNEFRALGCESELSHIPNLFAVEVPGAVSFDAVADLLTSGAQAGRWEYEEACLRHPIPTE